MTCPANEARIKEFDSVAEIPMFSSLIEELKQADANAEEYWAKIVATSWQKGRFDAIEWVKEQIEKKVRFGWVQINERGEQIKRGFILADEFLEILDTQSPRLTGGDGECQTSKSPLVDAQTHYGVPTKKLI